MTAARLNHSANSGRHRLVARGPDLYETPTVAVEALLRVEKLPRLIWEPACGPGAIVRILRDAGRQVIATDLNDWGCPDSKSSIDFLMQCSAPDGIEAIVTNPPYKLADQFVAHALELPPLVVMLLRLAFLESERRTPILEFGRLARVHLFRRRLPMMHRVGWTGPKASSSIPFAWFCWEWGHAGPTMIDRIPSALAGRRIPSPPSSTSKERRSAS
jgi:hypothetical protein